MNEEKEEEFAKRTAEIYKEIEPSLLALAHRLKAPNPQVTVKEWMSRAYVIIRRFDQGELVSKVYKDADNQDEMIAYDPALHDKDKFIKALKNYLKQSFTNDVLKAYSKRKKRREILDSGEAVRRTTSEFSNFGSDSISGIFKYDAIKIDSIMKIVEQDIKRTSGEISFIADAIQERFLLAIYNCCVTLKNRGNGWEDLVVVSDINEKDNKKFFTYDFRSELEDGVRKELCKIIISETNPIFVRKLGVIANPKNKHGLQKRLFRYLYEYKRGFPERLRVRVKNRSL